MDWGLRTRRAVDVLAAPLIAFIGAQSVAYFSAVGAGHPAWGTGTWVHFDAGHYISVAEKGYEVFPCRGGGGDVCGNAAWFPGVGWLAWPFMQLGLSADDVILVFARLFTFGALVLVWNLFLDRKHDMGAYTGLAFAAFVPGVVYFHAVFPMAAAAFFLCATFGALRRRRHGWAALAGFVGATMYPIMAFVAPVAAVWLLLDRQEEGEPATPWPARLVRAALVAGGVLAGTLLVFVVMRVQTGVWDGFYDVQSKYDYRMQLPFEGWYDRAHPTWNTAVGPVGITAFQATFVLGLLIVVAVNEIRRGLRGLALLILGWSLVVWAVPLTLGHHSIWRTDTLLLPAAYLVARLPRALAVLVVLGAVAVAAPMVVLYVEGDLI